MGRGEGWGRGHWRTEDMSASMRSRVMLSGMPSCLRFSIENAAAVAIDTAATLTAVAKATKMGRSHVSPRKAAGG